jgi:hypothetical protein
LHPVAANSATRLSNISIFFIGFFVSDLSADTALLVVLYLE